jgi:hypothetical protein
MLYSYATSQSYSLVYISASFKNTFLSWFHS